MKTPFLLALLFAAPLIEPTLTCLRSAPPACIETSTKSASATTICTRDPVTKPATAAKPAPATKTRRLPPDVLRG